MKALNIGNIFFSLFSQLFPSTHARHSVQLACARNLQFHGTPREQARGRAGVGESL